MGKRAGRARARSGFALSAGAIFAALTLALLVPGASGTSPAEASPAAANEMPERRPGASTGLPVPRFVSLKSGRANVRRGPGTDFPIDWVYRKNGVPLEIIAESHNWRRIRDHEGDGGWIWHTMLAGERTAIIDGMSQGEAVPLRSTPGIEAATTAYAEPGLVARVTACKAGWCRLDTKGHQGWVAQRMLWGIYPGEEFE
jgi:SH3-like domain-containing protein